jgi:hypothetical protein
MATMTRKHSWTGLALTCAGAAVLFGLTTIEACAKADDEAPAVDGGGLEAAPDVSKETGNGGSAGEAGGTGGTSGAAGTGGSSGKGGSPATGGSGGGTGGVGGDDGGGTPDGSVPCGTKFCWAMVCVPDAGFPNITMTPCCTDTDECGVVVLSINCVTPTQAQGLGFECTPK